MVEVVVRVGRGERFKGLGANRALFTAMISKRAVHTPLNILILTISYFSMHILGNYGENITKHQRHSSKSDRISRSRPLHFDRAEKMLLSPNFDLEEGLLFIPEFRNHNMKRSRAKRNIKENKAKIEKTNSHQIAKLKSYCEGKKTTYKNSSIVCNHLASSVEGLIVILNPNEPDYKTNAVKNNFIGFKILVHSPYDFPEVDAVGMAMNQNIRSYIGIRGYHSWITEAADRWKPDKKKCASKDDIELDVFEDYTRKNCVFECQAKEIFDKCGCLPYHYPDFHLAWEGVNSSTCNITGLLCLPRVPGRLKLNIILSKNLLFSLLVHS